MVTRMLAQATACLARGRPSRDPAKKGNGSFSKSGGPRDPKGYRGIIRGFYRAPLRDYIGVILRNTH